MKEFKKINGINICIDDEGTGMPVILVHGLSSSKEIMYPVRDMIKGKYRAISYDTRGHGESEKMPSYTLEDHIDDLVEIIKEYGKGEPVDLIGFSMGSYISNGASAKAPELVRHLILLGTKGEGSTSSVERIFAERGMKAEEASEMKKMLALMGATFAPKTSLLTKAKMVKYRSKVKLTDADKVAETKALHNFDLFPGMAGIKAKTLVVAGQYDGINPPEYGKKVADAIPGARYVEIKDAAHMMMLEKPEELSEIILSFLSE